MMRKSIQRVLAIAALSTIAVSAQAEGLSQGLHFVLTGGLTGGGDNIATVNFVGGNSEKINAGGLVQLGGGLLWQAGSVPLATQLTINYHVDNVTASNGSAKFDRIPIEATLFYTGVDRWRFGVGARFINSSQYTSEITNISNETMNFKNTIGALVEVGYGFSPHSWLNVRLVSEKYKPTTDTYNGVTVDASNWPSYDGSHIGVNFLYAF